jgi:hypothetical protein
MVAELLTMVGNDARSIGDDQCPHRHHRPQGTGIVETILKEDVRLDDFPHYLEVIIRKSCRCRGIIDHLLNFGKKSDGMAVKVGMNKVLQEFLELIRNQPGYRQIRISTMSHEHQTGGHGLDMGPFFTTKKVGGAL